MTTYGTIPTSSSPTVANLEYVSRAKDRLKAGLGTRRPWKEMFNFHCFGLPQNVSDAVSRIKYNVGFFLMNYAIVVLIILFLSLLWHPISLLVFIFMMAAWIFFYFLRDEPLVIVGRTINDHVVLIVLAIVTVVLLLLTGATGNILIAVAIGAVVVLLHGVFRKTDDLYLDEEAAGFLSDAAAVRVPLPPRG